MRRASVILLALTLLLPPVWASAQASGPIYIVQPGDTLTAIAQKFGTTIDALVQANQVPDPSSIFPGTELIIPGFEGVSGVLTTREVELGETLTSLSLRSGVAPETLIRLNRVVSPGRVYLGEPVIVPEEPDSPFALAKARIRLTGTGDNWLELAVRSGQNPWSLRVYNRQEDRMWILPGATLAFPGGETPTWSLPEPFVAAEVIPDPGVQGRTVELRVELSSAAAVEGQLGNWTLHFHQAAPLSLVALQGIHAMAEPGFYELQIMLLASQPDQETYAFSQPVRVVEGGYPFDPPLPVPAQTLDPAVTGPEDQLIESIVSQTTPERLWEGLLQFPSLNTESFPSRFGSRRNYNNTGYTYYHSGLDFYGREGTPILAPASGRVVFVGPLTVRGKTTLIDHGWGVFTGYLHQSEILVSVGDIVEPGQTIGLVGATGRVTGPHLHWEVWVGGVPVDPLEWTSVTFP